MSHRYQRCGGPCVVIGAVTANRLPYRSRVHDTGPDSTGPAGAAGNTRLAAVLLFRNRVIALSAASRSGYGRIPATAVSTRHGTRHASTCPVVASTAAPRRRQPLRPSPGPRDAGPAGHQSAPASPRPTAVPDLGTTRLRRSGPAGPPRARRGPRPDQWPPRWPAPSAARPSRSGSRPSSARPAPLPGPTRPALRPIRADPPGPAPGAEQACRTSSFVSVTRAPSQHRQRHRLAAARWLPVCQSDRPRGREATI
jgi:hypothetical protein